MIPHENVNGATARFDNEPFSLVAIRMCCYWIGVLLIVGPLSSGFGIVGAMAAVTAGMFAANYLKSREVRTVIVVLGCLAVVACSQCSIPQLVVRWLVAWVGITATVGATDALMFGLLAFGITILVRTLAATSAVLRLCEVICLTAPVVQLFAGHRDMRLGQPRFLTDWALSRGFDPHTLLLGVGVITTIGIAILLLPRQRLSQSAGAIVIFLVFSVVGYQALGVLLSRGDLTHFSGSTRDNDQNDKSHNSTPAKEASPNNKSSRPEEQHVKSSNDSSSDPDEMPFVPNPNPRPSTPVGVVTLSDDYSPGERVWHFRTAALSQYNGQRFVVAAASQVDEDIPHGFPAERVELPGASSAEDVTQVVRTTVGLLSAQSRPLCLVSPQVIEPYRESHSKLFVSSYRVESRVPKTNVSEFGYLVGMVKLAAGSPSWNDQTKEHYLAGPEDPRYAELAAQIMAESVELEKIMPEYRESAYLKALCVRRWLEKNMTYTMKPGHAPDANPVAEFLFGNRRGYCVHVAHAMASLLRTLGVPARVATGFAVKTENVSTKTSLTIQSTDAHAWAEIYLTGIGWIPVDASLENVDSDVPTSDPFDASTALHLANELRGSNAPGQNESSDLAARVGYFGRRFLMTALVLVLCGPYLVKIWRRLAPHIASRQTLHRLCYRTVLDRLAEVGLHRRAGETREEFSERVAPWAPQLPDFTQAHERYAGGANVATEYDWRFLQRVIEKQLSTSFSLRRRLIGLLHPLSWTKVH